MPNNLSTLTLKTFKPNLNFKPKKETFTHHILPLRLSFHAVLDVMPEPGGEHIHGVCQVPRNVGMDGAHKRHGRVHLPRQNCKTFQAKFTRTKKKKKPSFSFWEKFCSILRRKEERRML